ncbi:MAG: LamG domain-containing protein [Bacteroidales bacterium]|nr:MAG: LamG domain-containing protein [Bacteroidales bacterium]
MKRITILSYISILIVSLTLSCSNKDVEQGDLSKGELSLKFSLASEVKSTDVEDIIKCVPAAIYISIKDSDSKFIINTKKIALIKIGDEYITEHIELTEGIYTIEDFIVVDDTDSVLYLTPKVNSEFQDLVENPLPVTFEIFADNITNLVLEVIPANIGNPVQFGYATFSFTIVNTLEKGLVVHFPFDGDISEESENNYPFTADGVSLTYDRFEKPDKAAYFDGSGVSINLNNDQPVILSITFTISAWVKMNSPEGGIDYPGYVIFQQRDDNATYDNSSSLILFWSESKEGLVRFTIRSSINENAERGIVDSPSPGYEKWHHYAAVLDNEKMMKLYLDGLLMSDTLFTQTGDFITSIDHVDIGIHTYSGDQLNGALNGSMDDFRIYNRALTPQEIYSLYKSD